MKAYLDLVQNVLDNGIDQEHPNGIRKSIFGAHIVFDPSESASLVTVKKTNWKNPIAEMIWFCSGSTCTDDLMKCGAEVNFWKQWETQRDIGNTYGAAYRRAPNNGVPTVPGMSGDHVDQLQLAVNILKDCRRTGKSDTRARIAVYIPEWIPDRGKSRWENVRDNKGVLTPCASFLHFTIAGNKLNLNVYQASMDLLIGGPFNFIEFDFLLNMMAITTGYEVGKLFYTIGDCHIYGNQVDTLNDSGMMLREPKEVSKIVINPDKDIFNVTIDDVNIVSESHPFIKFEVTT